MQICVKTAESNKQFPLTQKYNQIVCWFDMKQEVGGDEI